MSYYKLLRKFVAESGYSNKEIIEECNKRGRKIDKAYFSRLLNGKVNPPTEELSRMLSEILNVDERYLVLEGYIEKAPKEIKELLVTLKKVIYITSLNLFENKIDEKSYEKLDEILEEQPLTDFVISLTDIIKNSEMSKNTLELFREDNNFKLTLAEPLAISVTDEGMYPKITSNSQVILTIQDKYENMDILAVKTKDENMIIRFALFENEDIILKPLNNQYETQKYNVNDIIILGKVTKFITNI